LKFFCGKGVGRYSSKFENWNFAKVNTSRFNFFEAPPIQLDKGDAVEIKDRGVDAVKNLFLSLLEYKYEKIVKGGIDFDSI